MNFDFTQMGVNKGKTRASDKPTTVRVTSPVLAQVAANGLRQAQITIRGKDAETLKRYVGALNVQIGEKTYVLHKGNDTHALWVKDQNGSIQAFGELFNLLAATPDKAVECTITAQVQPGA